MRSALALLLFMLSLAIAVAGGGLAASDPHGQDPFTYALTALLAVSIGALAIGIAAVRDYRWPYTISAVCSLTVLAFLRAVALDLPFDAVVGSLVMALSAGTGIGQGFDWLALLRRARRNRLACGRPRG